jgi:hypothetical protein
MASRNFNLFARLYVDRKTAEGAVYTKELMSLRVSEGWTHIPLVAEALSKLVEGGRVDLPVHSEDFDLFIEAIKAERKKVRNVVAQDAIDALLKRAYQMRKYRSKALRNSVIELAAWPAS